ncbi:MAG: hypothetical protein JNL82_14920 [Myxococcales bacterium]|nr:hypothetical protein [Myxococcales bacterium]
MPRAPAKRPQPDVSTDERRRVLHNLDRIEDRLRDAPEGLHDAGDPADPAALAASPLPAAARLLWARFDGLELAHGELRLYSLAALADAQAEAEERLAPGDVVIGERGGDVLVLAGDPHAEGADVVLVEEDGERLPHSSCIDLLVLAALGEAAVLFDEEGEFQADLFGDDGELSHAAERRMLRRHLDLDPDAPLARFRLAQSLRRGGEFRAAAGELGQLLRRAPEFAWAHHELGRARLGLGDAVAAARAFVDAAEHAREQGLAAYFYAWACLARGTGPEGQEDRRAARVPERAALASAVLTRSPNFAAAQEAGVREALEADEGGRAREMLALGLAVVPGHLGLLSLREAAAAAPEHAVRPEHAVEEVEEAIDEHTDDELADDDDDELADDELDDDE